MFDIMGLDASKTIGCCPSPLPTRFRWSLSFWVNESCGDTIQRDFNLTVSLLRYLKLRDSHLFTHLQKATHWAK